MASTPSCQLIYLLSKTFRRLILTREFSAPCTYEMTDPLVPLKDTKAVDDAVQAVLKSQQYKGLFLADQASQLGESYEKNKAMLLSQEELDLLLLYNAHLYQQAAEGILSGEFAINPYTENGRSIAPYVEQYKSITGF